MSLKQKVGLLTIMVAFLLSVATAVSSYCVYSRTVDQYYRDRAMNIARTAAVVVDPQQVREYRDQVMEIYRRDPMPEWSDPVQKQQYLAQYAGIRDEAYEALLETLEELRIANQAVSLYIIYPDRDSMSGIYLADPDTSESACPMGTWNVIEKQNYEAMDHIQDGFPAYISNTEYGWLCSAAAAILDQDGSVVALATVDLSMDEIMQENHRFLVLLCVFLAGVSSILALLLMQVTNRILVAPINRVITAAGSYVDDRRRKENGENDRKTAIEQLEIHTGDEIEQLAGSIRQMERDVSQYIDNLAAVTSEKERIGAELNIATQIQASMLPRIFPPFPERKDINIYATMDPAKEVGGDFYDFFLTDQYHLGMVIADVSGKGVPAALVMVIAKTLIKDHACSQAEPDEVFNWVNQQLCESNEAGLFVTAWMGILDLRTGHLDYVNAGHNPPVLTGADGTFGYLKQKPGLVLAGMDEYRYQKASMDLQKGDRLFLYTDGVTEAMNQDDQLYGETRLLNWLNGHPGLELQETLHGLRKDITEFAEGAEQYDDITMLIFERQ
ncbi:MAG: PP2C family protein-serine/threonine phosphatase [Eubacteriales bacterium]|nr:PP2C family protein-serine/threonine phosphatase [Eubacteriales bacterium]